jgi:hypothetical protein
VLLTLILNPLWMSWLWAQGTTAPSPNLSSRAELPDVPNAWGVESLRRLALPLHQGGTQLSVLENSLSKLARWEFRIFRDGNGTPSSTWPALVRGGEGSLEVSYASEQDDRILDVRLDWLESPSERDFSRWRARELYVAGRDGDNDLWWYPATGNQWTAIGNRGVAAGALAASPR